MTSALIDDQAAPRIAIVGGTGALGFGLALRLASAGLEIRIGSREAARAELSASRVESVIQDANISGYDNRNAVAWADVVILSVPFLSHVATLKTLRTSFRAGQTLLDATVPLATAVGGTPTRTLGLWQGSAAEQAQSLLPEGVEVVSGFHTVSASTLADLDKDLREHVLLCGDNTDAKHAAAQLIDRIPGLDAVDCGALEMARVLEQLTPLLISINIRHRTHSGIAITGLA